MEETLKSTLPLIGNITAHSEKSPKKADSGEIQGTCDVNKNEYAVKTTDKKNSRAELSVSGVETDVEQNKTCKKYEYCSDLDDESAQDDVPPSKRQKLSSKVHKSPKKRLELSPNKSSTQFIYGNYSRYYGYRNLKDFQDVRLTGFEQQPDLFDGKEVLDVGCNSGLITMEIAKKFKIRHITGIDIDKNLVHRATKFVQRTRKGFKGDSKTGFPFNINFVHGNYVLIDDVLLEIERAQFDLILCLSVTKWIQLNFGDNGLKQAFRRMFLQLRPGGRLVLEAQPWLNYKRRKKLTPEILENYKSIKFLPSDFTSYLLGPEVGFSEIYNLEVPRHCAEGFRRPIQVFVKGTNTIEGAQNEKNNE